MSLRERAALVVLVLGVAAFVVSAVAMFHVFTGRG